MNLRFLERDWRPIEAFPKSGNYVGAKARHNVTTRQRILTALAKRDRARLERSLAALAESADGEPWLLAWALYREAKKLRIGASVSLLERKPPKASSSSQSGC
ncbi:MAG: hypothetical protein H0W81_02055 [Chloroflexi bacterium]|nr:hypothetical protein [Chloroflexota bacterium]